MSWDLVDEVGPWLPENRQELPLKLFDGYKLDDIKTWTIRSGGFRHNQLIPNRLVKGKIDGVEVDGREPIGPALIVASHDDDRMWSQDDYARYFANAKKHYVDGDPKPEPKPKVNLKPGELYLAGKKIGEVVGAIKTRPLSFDLTVPQEQISDFMKIMNPAFTPDEETEEAMGKKEDPTQKGSPKRTVTVLVYEPGDIRDVEDAAITLEVPTAELHSEAGKRILTEVIPEVIELFLNKSNDYKNAHESLGPKAQYVDLHRKMGKLKSALWDGQELQYEQVDEILMDLAGHVFLALDGINKENNK